MAVDPDRHPTLLPPYYGAFLVAFRADSAPLAGARRQGRTPSISISSEKLRNVLISTIIASTRTLSSVGATATVLIRSAATRISSPRSKAAPNACRSAVYARCSEPERRQASTARITDHSRPIVKISAPRPSNAWAANPIAVVNAEVAAGSEAAIKLNVVTHGPPAPSRAAFPRPPPCASYPLGAASPHLRAGGGPSLHPEDNGPPSQPQELSSADHPAEAASSRRSAWEVADAGGDHYDVVLRGMVLCDCGQMALWRTTCSCAVSYLGACAGSYSLR